MSDPRALARRFIRQRIEMGDRDLVLGGPARVLLDSMAVAPAQVRAPVAGPPDRSAAARTEAAPIAAPPADPPASGPSAEEILSLPTLESVRALALGCPRCRLAETRQRVVFSAGSSTARVAVVGEAPGLDEERAGEPALGPAGQLQRLLLASVGIAADDLYLCALPMCRPPADRGARADEVDACSPYLVRQLELLRPRVILAYGGTAAGRLLETDLPIAKLRGGTHAFREIPLVATYAPSALLRTPGWVRPAWEDLQRLRSILDGG